MVGCITFTIVMTLSGCTGAKIKYMEDYFKWLREKS